MNAKLRVLSTLAGLAIGVGACGGGSTPAPSTGGGGASQPAPSTGGGASAAPSTALKGSLTIWHSYGSGAGACISISIAATWC